MDRGAEIELTSISKNFKRGEFELSILKNLDLKVHSGEFLSIMGPSGSGKSTLLNIIGGLEAPTSGDVRVSGESINSMNSRRLAQWRSKHAGYIFQMYHLIDVLSAQANVEVPLKLRNLTRGQRKRKVAAALELVGMSDRAGHKPSELSGGQAQRVAIARAIVGNPSLLLCDEPTGDLDQASTEGILSLLRGINEQFHTTILMVTHDPVAARCGDRIVHVSGGALCESSAL